MNKRLYIADLLLLIAAIIWGTAFAFQRQAMEHIGPFTYTGIRFLVGALILFPYALIYAPLPKEKYKIYHLWPAAIVGVFLFAGASLQQWGLVYTTEANSGFITGSYVIIVPIFYWLIFKKVMTKWVWIAASIMLLGMFFVAFFGAKPQNITGQEQHRIWGDLLTLLCAFFWAGHIISLSILSKKIPPLWIAAIQFFVCGIFAMLVAVWFEDLSLRSIWEVRIPILYGSLISVVIAYTLQVIAQQHTLVTHATFILALEAAFAAIGGWLINGQSMTIYGIFGAMLMFMATLTMEFMGYLKKDRLKI